MKQLQQYFVRKKKNNIMYGSKSSPAGLKGRTRLRLRLRLRDLDPTDVHANGDV